MSKTEKLLNAEELSEKVRTTIEEAGKEAVIISNESDSNIRESLRGSENNVDAAAEIIIETVL